jgi:methanogenic corrinoid protein MtbC1
MESFSSLIFSKSRPAEGSSRDTSAVGPVFVTAIPGELHEVSPRIIADLLELDGFDTTLVSASGSLREGDEAANYGAAILVVTTPRLLLAANDIAAELRSEAGAGWLAIGGDALNAWPRFCAKLRADATFNDALGAIETIEARASQQAIS